jgi:threonine/homoserine/homoserine lactone efflux protein
MSFIPEPHVLIAYTLASLILFITPGPDMSLFLARTLSSGTRAGIASAVGSNLGCIVHTTLAALGISALVAASAAAFLALKVIGAGYLLYLAWDAIRNGSALTVKKLEHRPIATWKSFAAGFMMDMTNPKVVLFFITFLPQFVGAGDPHLQGKLFFLGLWFVAINTPLSIAMVLVAERLVLWLKTRPRALRGIDYTFAGVFGYFAVKIALTEGR